MEDDSSSLLEDEESVNGTGWTVQSFTAGPKVAVKIPPVLKRPMQWWITREMFLLLKLAVPIILTMFLQQLYLMISFVFVGRIHTDEESSITLDAAVLGISFVNITGISIGVGISSASDTLSAQTYGFGNYKQVGVIFQRSVLICFLLSVFIACIWLNTESLLLLLQQNPCIARHTAEFVQIFILALFPAFLNILLQKYLQTQNIVWPFVFGMLLTNIVSAAGNAVFVFGFNFGIKGVAGALVLTNFFQPIFLICYIKLRKLHRKTWGGWSLESLEGWGRYLRLGVPGMFMICLEWISFEVAAIVLGTVNEIELAVHGILINYLTLIFMVPLGVGIAVSVRVGNELGGGNPQGAKRASWASVVIAVINLMFMVCLTQGIKYYLGQFYNAEPEVNDKVMTVLNLACGIFIADHTQCILSGILRGAGHQFRGAIINFVAFYVFGLPIGISLALFTDLGALGMWSGLSVATFIQMTFITVLLLCLNWDKEAELAMSRGGKGNVGGDNNSVAGNHDDGNHGNGSHDDVASNDIEMKRYRQLQQNEEGEEQDHTHQDEGEGGDLSDVQPLVSDDISVKSDNSEDEIKPLEAGHVDNKWAGHHGCLATLKHRWKLLAFHSCVVGVAILCLVVAGVASSYHPPDNWLKGNYSECTNTTD